MLLLLLIPVAIGIDDTSSKGLKKLSSGGISGKDERAFCLGGILVG